MFIRRKKVVVKRRRNDRGTAVVIAVLVMALLSVFVAATLSRVTTEALSTGNDYGNTQTFYAALASLELMSRNFDDIFITKLNPQASDINYVQTQFPGNITTAGGGDFTWVQQATQIATNQTTTVASGPYRNLQAGRDAWELTSTCTGPNGVQVQVSKSFYNYRVPIFQFGIFYENDMEFHPGPAFAFGGRVHSNRDIYLMCGGGGLDFTSPITAVGHIVRTVNRNNVTSAAGSWTGTVRITNGTVLTAITQGSVTGGPDTSGTLTDRPLGTVNAGWTAHATLFNGNVLAGQPPLQLPLQLGNANNPIEIIKRGRSTDDAILSPSRYYNKSCIRITLDDSRERLPRTYWPGNSNDGEFGGVRLDGASEGPATGPSTGWPDVDSASTPAAAPTPGDRGYLPQAMVGGNQATRVNGWRFYRGATYTDGGGRPTPDDRETWIKVEFVYPNVNDVVNPFTMDVTRAFLSLGLTDEGINNGTIPAAFLATGSHPADTAIVKLQRWVIPGVQVESAAAPNNQSSSVDAGSGNTVVNYLYNAVRSLNYLDVRTTPIGAPPVDTGLVARVSTFESNPSHFVNAVGGERLAPFPIVMFDAREGVFNEGASDATLAAMYGGAAPNHTNVPMMGVMSMVEIDVRNLRSLVAGTYNALLPASGFGAVQGGAIGNTFALPGTPSSTTITNGNIPNHNGTGTIVYVSDRRGDWDFDGEFDHENVYMSNATEGRVGNNPVYQVGENTNLNMDTATPPAAILDWDYLWEAATFDNWERDRVANTETQLAANTTRTGYRAFRDHKYFRRGVRLINGGGVGAGNTSLPGLTQAVWAARSAGQAAAWPDQEGFTLCTENAAYILGQFNQPNGVHPAWPGPGPSLPAAYDIASEVPASVVADCVYVLSNGWTDARSFRFPFASGGGNRPGTQTSVRAAFLVGRPMPSLQANPNQQTIGGTTTESNLSGGVHNFPRFLETWGASLNYCGSLINLYWSRVNTGPYKNGNARVYSPPGRNWVFDVSFQDLRRLPPGTPFFQFVQSSGFRQTFRQT
jgi:hypothetical protein